MTVLIDNRRAAARSDQQPLEYATVDRRQRLQISDSDALVELVDRSVDRPELDDLGTNVGDETTIRCASGAGEFGDDAADLAYRRAGDVHQLPACGQIGLARAGPANLMIQAVPRQDREERPFEILARV